MPNFYQSYSVTSLVLFTKITNDRIREKKILYIWLLQWITLCQRRQKIKYLDTITFLVTRACINKPCWQSSGIIIFTCKYYMVLSDTLIGSPNHTVSTALQCQVWWFFLSSKICSILFLIWKMLRMIPIKYFFGNDNFKWQNTWRNPVMIIFYL